MQLDKTVTLIDEQTVNTELNAPIVGKLIIIIIIIIIIIVIKIIK